MNDTEKLNHIVGQLQQRLQPGGSPPPGDEVVLADWIIYTARGRIQHLEQDHDIRRQTLLATLGEKDLSRGWLHLEALVSELQRRSADRDDCRKRLAECQGHASQLEKMELAAQKLVAAAVQHIQRLEAGKWDKSQADATSVAFKDALIKWNDMRKKEGR